MTLLLTLIAGLVLIGVGRSSGSGIWYGSSRRRETISESEITHASERFG